MMLNVRKKMDKRKCKECGKVLCSYNKYDCCYSCIEKKSGTPDISDFDVDIKTIFGSDSKYQPTA